MLTCIFKLLSLKTWRTFLSENGCQIFDCYYMTKQVQIKGKDYLGIGKREQSRLQTLHIVGI